MSNDPIIIDTPEGIDHFRCSAVIAALNIEVKTGMKATRVGSPLKAAQQSYGVTARTKAKALDQMLDYYLATYGQRSTFDKREA